jgi:hypothetical protein
MLRLAVSGLGIAMLCALCVACEPECADDVVSYEGSPDGRYVATVFVRNCHATSPFVTIVSIRPRDEAFDPDGEYVLSVHGRVPVSVRWESATQLAVSHPSARVYRSERSWRDVTIRYRASG